MRMTASIFAAALFAALASAGAACAADKPPYDGRLFDAHVHYSANSWASFTPEAAIDLMAAEDVIGAVVSSTPDGGTRRLAAVEQSKVRIVPLYRPCRESSDLGSWFKRPDRLNATEQALMGHHRKGLGEVHIHRPANLDGERIQNIIRTVAEAGLFIQPHADHAVVARLFEIAPDLKIIWAHAGFSDPPDVIGRMMDKHETLWADLSYREIGIIESEGLNPKWEALLIRHADRFMIGSDTWETDRWHGYAGIIDENRHWLGQLPRAVADKIAQQNAERLFGIH